MQALERLRGIAPVFFMVSCRQNAEKYLRFFADVL
jgi:hypothetical protein